MSINTELSRILRNAESKMKLAEAVAFGGIPGFGTIDKFGESPSVSISQPGTIWDLGTQYIYDSTEIGTAPIAYLVSNSAADAGKIVSIQGLDADGCLVTQSATLNGTTNVTLTTPLWRVFRMFNESPAGNDLDGTVYCHTNPTPTAGEPGSDNIRALIDDGNNQTLMAVYTVPRDYVGFLYRGEIGCGTEAGASSSSEFARVIYKSRLYNKNFRIKKRKLLSLNGQSGFQDVRSFPDVIPALTDIEIDVEEVSIEMRIDASFDILLIKQDRLFKEYLDSIGQPFSEDMFAC